MNGVALLLAAASLAVDYSWEKSAAGQMEYMVRVEAEVIPSLVAGEEIHSDVPAEAGTVERFRLRVGIDGNQPVFTPAAPGRLGVAPDRSAMLVKSGQAAAETTGVSFGWQPNTDGKLMYYVQIDPSLLRELEVGDEIQAVVDTSAGPTSTFVVFGGNKQLPRIPTGGAGAASTAAGAPPSRFSPEGDASPASGQIGDSRFGGYEGAAAPAAATDPGSSRFGGTGAAGSAASPPPASSTPPSRFGGTGATDPNSSATNSRFGPNGSSAPGTGAGAGSGTGSGTRPFNDSRSTFTPPPLDNPSSASANSGRNPNTYGPPPASSGSDLFSSQGNTYRNPPAQQPAGRTFDNRPTLDPPQASSANRPLPPANSDFNQNPPNAAPPQQPAAAAPNANDRMAMVDPNTTRGAAEYAPQAPAAPPVAAAEAEKPWWWGWLVFFFCVMCLSIGGNLYLGWTAVEFYQRYQRAVERLRSGTSPARV